MKVAKTPHAAASDTLARAATKAGLAASALKAARQWLAEQLVAYEYAKLGQGGHTSTQIPLRQVFVDLPVTSSPSAVHQHEQRVLFLGELLSSPPLNLHEAFSARAKVPTSPHADEDDVEADDERFQIGVGRFHREASWGATLLIGGPGQGKSTLGQLACQLHRAALVKPAEAELTSSQRDLVNSFVPKSAARMGRRDRQPLGLPKVPFLPLQIALPDFAAWLVRNQTEFSTGQLPNLLRFLADLPSAKTFNLSAQDLFGLASHMPSLLVLDGFDEVGATHDRERIVGAGRELLTALAQSAATSQIVATTRPQGYADELAQIGIRFEKRYLAPLERSEALEYARKLVEAKIPGADQRQKALAQIHEAAAEPATERLLTTPLQVTILTALVQQLGRAPRERWNLFSRYFAYTYDREIERNTYASSLLAEHRAHIERIHARVALLLQVEAERDGGASARMTRTRFEEVIAAVLLEDEVSELDRVDLVREIASAAENRLVFLVEPEPGKFGFEIRSLQEFMAASALTSGRDTEVEARLIQVAKAPMFRNVALFAASRLFSEGSPLRDILANRVSGSMDDDPDDQITRLTRAGALLALETLEEGAVLSQPKRARALMTRAVGLLQLPGGSEHVRLARITNGDTSGVVREAISAYFEDSRNEGKCSANAAWVCLIDAANRDEVWALELGEIFWPPRMPVASLFETLARVRVPLGRWVVKKIEEDCALISPSEFLEVPVLSQKADSPSTWVSWLIAVFGSTGIWRRRKGGGAAQLAPAELPSELPRPTASPPGDLKWLTWIAAATYEASPSASSLAVALVQLADAFPIAKLKSLQWRFSWPLGTCLASATTPEDLMRYASRLRLNELGDIGDWRSAEAAWKEELVLSELIADLDDDLPWTLASIAQRPPLLSLPVWRFIERAHSRSRKLPAAAELQNVNVAFLKCRSPSVRQRLAEMCLFIWRSLPVKSPYSAFDAKAWILASPTSASMLVPRPKFLPADEWLVLLDACSLEPSHPWFLNFSGNFDALGEQPTHPVLLRLATIVVAMYSEHMSISEQLKPAQVKIAANALNSHRAASVASRGDMATLQMFLGGYPAERDNLLFRDIIEAADSDVHLWSRLLSALSASRLPRDRVQSLLVTAYSAMGSNHDDASSAIRQMRDALQKRTSDLDSTATWNRLALPLPYPMQPLQARLEGGMPRAPVRIESLQLRDICGVQDLTLAFNPPAAGKGQWIVILGPNGVGKTTLLRSLALALRSVKHPGIWPKGAFGSPWQRVIASEELKPIAESSIVVRLGDGMSHRTLIRPGGSISITQLPEQDNPRLFPLFAYGCRRGSALGGAARQVNLNDDDGPEVATLFDDGADLIQAETWLVALEGDTTKNPKSEVIFESVVGAIKSLLDLEDVRVTDQKLWVKERGRPMLPFSSLSDGYLTNAGWFLDLVARWIKIADRTGQIVEPDFLCKMRGLVLIDEVDLHLHPRWQIEIISRTRRLLPEMSFVVTTHNPLTLVGARPEEIWILSSESDRIVAAGGAEAPMLLTGGQIYRRYFGIEDIYPDGLGRALQRYSFLSGYALRNDEEQAELELLQTKLKGAGIDPGWDVVGRDDSGIVMALPAKKAPRRGREKTL